MLGVALWARLSPALPNRRTQVFTPLDHALSRKDSNEAPGSWTQNVPPSSISSDSGVPRGTESRKRRPSTTS
jgi:hypothetical protein